MLAGDTHDEDVPGRVTRHRCIEGRNQPIARSGIASLMLKQR
jgi:hypothetical protein